MTRKRAVLFFSIFVFVLAGVTFLWVSGITKKTSLRVVFLNAGQGDAIFIETPERFQILIDGGPDGTVLRELGRVMPPWDRTIDVMVSTHPDADHVAGLVDVLDRYRVAEIIGPGHPGTTDLSQVFSRSALAEHALQTGNVFEPFRIQTPSGVVFTFVHPRSLGIEPTATNENSVITRIDYKGESFLLAGDASSAIESRLAMMLPDFVDVDVLKLSHHGSKYSSGEYFLRRVSPELAIISVGCDNQFGHPAPITIKRLVFLHIPFRDTCTEGRITLQVTNSGRLEIK